MIAVLAFLLAGCGNAHPAASPAAYKSSPAVAPASGSASPESVRRAECTVLRSIRRSARSLSGHPVAGHVAQFAALGPGWAQQLAAAARPDGKRGFAARTGTASKLSARLSEMAVDLDLANLDYGARHGSKRSQAAKEYTAFLRLLHRTPC